MKRKLLYIGIASLMLMFSCKDYLDTESSSNIQDDFVYASNDDIFKAVLSVYTRIYDGKFLSDRVPMYMNGAGSDVELRPDYATTGRGEIINLYPNRTTQFMSAHGSEQWIAGYSAINNANEVITGIETYHPEVLTATAANDLTQMYGEVVVMRALAYFEMVRNFGDIPFLTEPSRTVEKIPTTNRWVILDAMLDDLERVAPIMKWASELPQNAERISKGFCYGMIAKIAVTRGGYSLHPNLADPNDWGSVKRDEANWKAAYERAYTALNSLVTGGKHSLITTDTRGVVNAGKNGIFSNPYQLVFQKQMDYEISGESLWELSLAREYGGNWGYAYARAHTGKSSTNISKAYGAVRLTPTYFYTFNPKDLRRDVTVSTTGTTGAGIEDPYNPCIFGDGAYNGLALNKWDKARMANPYNQASGKAGINYVYMRYSDALLLLAEVEYMLGKGDAKGHLKMVRSRAFSAADQQTEVTDYINGLSGDALYTAIKQERKWELGGENIIKHDLIRWGDFDKAIIDARAMLRAQADAIRTQGYYTFANGMEISDSIFVKACKKADMVTLGYNDTYPGLTYGTPAGQETNPFLVPAWRGVADTGFAKDYPAVSNLAIQGMFKHLTAAERNALRKKGYVAKPWGIQLVGLGTPYSDYVTKNWSGYTDEDYAAGKPARNISPIPGQTILDTGIDPNTGKNVLINYYGFANE